MRTLYIAEIESTIPETNVKCSKRLESEKPSELLAALAFTNGTGNGVPTLEQLLIHLYEKGAAYAGRNYMIYIKRYD